MWYDIGMPWRNQFKSNEEYNKWYREYRAKNREKMRKYYNKYNSKWRKANGYNNERNSKYRYPEKQHARRLLQSAVRNGIIKRGKCRMCGKENTHGHHDNYFEPLKVKWFCPLHHTMYHQKMSKTKGFRRG